MSIDAIRARWAGRDNAIRAGIPTSYREAVNLLVMAQEDTATLFRTLDTLTAERDDWEATAEVLGNESLAVTLIAGQRDAALARVAELEAKPWGVGHSSLPCMEGKMNNLVRLEDALRTVESIGARWEGEKLFAPSENQLWIRGLTDAAEAIAKKLRALPAIGTCADCFAWQRLAPDGKDGCCVWNATTVVHTLPDHYCAAWRVRE